MNLGTPQRLGVGVKEVYAANWPTSAYKAHVHLSWDGRLGTRQDRGQKRCSQEESSAWLRKGWNVWSKGAADTPKHNLSVRIHYRICGAWSENKCFDLGFLSQKDFKNCRAARDAQREQVCC